MKIEYCNNSGCQNYVKSRKYCLYHSSEIEKLNYCIVVDQCEFASKEQKNKEDVKCG